MVVAADAVGCPATAVVQDPVAVVGRASAALAVGIVLAEDNMAVVRHIEIVVVALVGRKLAVRSLGGSLVVEAAREVAGDELVVDRCRATAVVQDIRLVEAAVVRCKGHLADQAEDKKASVQVRRCSLDVVVVVLD